MNTEEFYNLLLRGLSLYLNEKYMSLEKNIRRSMRKTPNGVYHFPIPTTQEEYDITCQIAEEKLSYPTLNTKVVDINGKRRLVTTARRTKSNA